MLDSVDRILEQRLQRAGTRSWTTALIAAVVLHILTMATAWILQNWRREPPTRPKILAVRVIPAQRLGNPNAPRERPAATPPKPQPPPPRPAPPKAKPKPVAAAPEPEIRAPEPTPAAPTEAPQASVPPAAEPGRRGSPQGDPLGTSAFGARVAGLDNPAFTYDYYLDRMLAMIEAEWVRPPTGGEVEATLFFRIAKDGQISELRVVDPSGLRAFDLAAVRAVQKAAPLPPLPRSYRQDSLGVNLIVR